MTGSSFSDWIDRWSADVARSPHHLPHHLRGFVHALDTELRASAELLDPRVDAGLRALRCWSEGVEPGRVPLIRALAPLDHVPRVPPEHHRAAAVRLTGQAVLSLLVGDASPTMRARAAGLLATAHAQALRATEASSARLAVQKAELRQVQRAPGHDLVGALDALRATRGDVRARATARWVAALHRIAAPPDGGPYRPRGHAW